MSPDRCLQRQLEKRWASAIRLRPLPRGEHGRGTRQAGEREGRATAVQACNEAVKEKFSLMVSSFKLVLL